MRLRFKNKDTWAAIAFLSPNLIGFACFTLWPVAASLLLSFTSWDLLSPPRWVGLDNFRELLGFHGASDGLTPNDPKFWKYLWNTLVLLISMPITILGSLMLAVTLNRKIRFSHFYRVVLFLPHIVAGVAIFYLWRWMYNPDFGLINQFLRMVGITPPNWLTDYGYAKPALIIMSVWIGIGGSGMIMYLAALQNIPKSLYEAAEMDGAGYWETFVAVTWPGVKPITYFLLTMSLINGLQSGFEMAYVMTRGGPFGATTSIGYYIYEKAYVTFEMGYASAIAWFLFIIILAVTVLGWRKGGSNFTA